MLCILSPKEMIDIEKSPAIRKGTPGDWKHHLTVAQGERIDEMYEKELDGCDELKQFLNFRSQ